MLAQVACSYYFWLKIIQYHFGSSGVFVLPLAQDDTGPWWLDPILNRRKGRRWGPSGTAANKPSGEETMPIGFVRRVPLWRLNRSLCGLVVVCYKTTAVPLANG